MVRGDFESKTSNDGGTNGSSLVAMTIVHLMVRDLAYSASNKAQNRFFKQLMRGQAVFPPISVLGMRS
jgi:hypothetical protein